MFFSKKKKDKKDISVIFQCPKCLEMNEGNRKCVKCGTESNPVESNPVGVDFSLDHLMKLAEENEKKTKRKK